MKYHLNRKKDIMGPHHLEVLSLLVGALLGDAYGETRNNKSRIHFEQAYKNQEYLYWLHQFLASRGYCHINKPKILKRTTGKSLEWRHYLGFKTYSYGSFNWLVESFYPQSEKRLPDKNRLKMFLTPLALTIWICDDGTRSGVGLALCTNCFTKQEVQILCNILYELYGITATLQKALFSKKTKQVQYRLYIHKKSMGVVKSLVLPWMPLSMLYKLGM